MLEAAVHKLDHDYISKHVVQQIKDMFALNNPFAKRKLANRILLSVAKNTGEEFFDNDNTVFKMIMNILHDNNYKIRRDGVIFLKEYFRHLAQ